VDGGSWIPITLNGQQYTFDPGTLAAGKHIINVVSLPEMFAALAA
jgi:hypothetical protein